MNEQTIQELKRMIAELKERAQSATNLEEVEKLHREADRLKRRADVATLATKITGWKVAAWTTLDALRVDDLEEAIGLYRQHNGMVRIYAYTCDGGREQRHAVDNEKLVDLGFTVRQ